MVSHDDADYVVLDKLDRGNRPTSVYCHGRCSGLESKVPVLLAQLRYYLEQMQSFDNKLELCKYISVVLQSLRPYCLGCEYAFIIL
jgi:hypothetical protein